MCGIWGFDLPDGVVRPGQRELLARALAASNDVRGGDSWGVVLANGALDVHRGVGEAWMAPEMWELDFSAQHTILGHARKATTGAATVENAHPFEIGDYLGVHNGIVTNHSELNTEYKRTFAVDSMHIFAHLNEGLPTKGIRGYGAIAYFFKRDPGAVFLCRFFSGDLTVRGIDDPRDPKKHLGVIWSSSKFHLEDACKVAGLKTFAFEEPKPEKLMVVRNGILYDTKDTIEISSGWSNNYSRQSEQYLDAAYAGSSSGKDSRCSTRKGTTTTDCSLGTKDTSTSSDAKQKRTTKRQNIKSNLEYIFGPGDWVIIREDGVTALVLKGLEANYDVNGHVDSGDDKGSDTSISLPSQIN